MTTSLTHSALARLPSAFAAACRLSRTDAELFERCRDALVGRFNTDRSGSLSDADGLPRMPGPRVAEEGHRDAPGSGAARPRSSSAPAPPRPSSCGRGGAARARPRGRGRAAQRAAWSARRRSTTPPSSFGRSGRWPGCCPRCTPRRGNRAADPRFHGRGVLHLVGLPLPPRRATRYEPRKVFRSLDERIRPSPVDRAAAGRRRCRPAPGPPAGRTWRSPRWLRPRPSWSSRSTPASSGWRSCCSGPRINERPVRPAGARPGGHPLLRGGDRAQERAPRRAAPDRGEHRRADHPAEPPGAGGAARGRDCRAPSRHALDTTRHSPRPRQLQAGQRQRRPRRRRRAACAGWRRLLKAAVPHPDVVGRLGGDEFLVMLPMTSPREAMVLVGRGPGGSPALGSRPRVRATRSP